MAIDLHGPDAFGRGVALDQRLNELVQRLSRARRRVTINALLSALVFGLVIALGVFCVLQVLSGLFGSAWPVAFTFNFIDAIDRAVGQHLVVAGIVGVAAFVAAVATAISGRPWLNSMAAAADMRFRLDEMMSTALEVAADRRGGVVPEALLRSAQAHIGVVDADSLVPVRPPRIAFAVPVLLVLSVWLALSPPPALFQNTFSGGPGNAIPTAELAQRTQTVADLRAIAAIVRQDGEDRADPTLQAIARQLDDLAAQMDTTALGRDAAGAAIERLNNLLRGAYQRAGETTGGPRDHSRLLDDAFHQFDPQRAAAADAALQPATQPPPPQANPEAAGIDAPFEAVALHGGETEGGDPAAPPPGMGVRTDNLTRTDATQPGNRAEILDADPYNGEEDVYGPDGPDGPGGPIPPAGQFVGPAAGGEAGDIAGAGAAGLFGNTQAMTALEAAGQMLLADRDPGDGRRITLDLPPLTQLLRITDDGTPAPGGWEEHAEGQVTRTPVPVGDRDVIQRYFEALMAERAE